MFGFSSLDHSDKLFKRFLSPWYPDKDGPKATRPDMYVMEGLEEHPLDLKTLQRLESPKLMEVKVKIDQITDTALQDYQKIIKSEKFDLNVLAAVDKYFDRKKVSKIIKNSKPKDPNNPYLTQVCQFGAMLGNIFDQNEEFGWLYADPYFHSIIVHKKTGYAITVFDWAVKKFSSSGIDTGYAAKYIASSKTIQKQWLVSLEQLNEKL
jgi:hypothetical protein